MHRSSMLKPPPLPDDEFPHRFACTFFGMRILFSIVDHAIMKSTSRMLSTDIECTRHEREHARAGGLP